jgi:hypothetical protein
MRVKCNRLLVRHVLPVLTRTNHRKVRAFDVLQTHFHQLVVLLHVAIALLAAVSILIREAHHAFTVSQGTTGSIQVKVVQFSAIPVFQGRILIIRASVLVRYVQEAATVPLLVRALVLSVLWAASLRQVCMVETMDAIALRILTTLMVRVRARTHHLISLQEVQVLQYQHGQPTPLRQWLSPQSCCY